MPFDAGEDLELLAELGDPHRPRDRRALGPGRQAAAVPALEGRRQRGPHGLVEAEALGEGVGDLARRAEVQLGRLAAAGEDRRAPSASRPDARLARPGAADHHPQDVDRVGAVGPQRPRPAARSRRRTPRPSRRRGRCSRGSAAPTSTTWSPAPPRRRRRRRRGAGRAPWPAAASPGGWPKAWSWATASSAAISTWVTSPRTAATVDGEFSRCGGPPRSAHRLGHDQNTITTQSDPKIEAVQRLYAAYGRGDIDAVLAELADDVDWAAEAASTSVPWYGSYRGKAEVPRFFKEIGSNVDVTEFTPLSLHVERDRRDRHHPLDLHRARHRQDARRCTCSTGGASPTARSCSSAAPRTPSSRRRPSPEQG